MERQSTDIRQLPTPVDCFRPPLSPELVPPFLLSANRINFIESLVGTATSLIESCWPNHSYSSRTKLIPLRRFIQEILRRSRTSFSTLQLALLYLVRLRNALQSASSSSIPSPSFPLHCTSSSNTVEPSKPSNLESSSTSAMTPSPCICGRRMFLASLLLAAKYLQDRNYSNRAWSKIAGLTISEINANEREFLAAIDYNLYVSKRTFTTWSGALMGRAAAAAMAASQTTVESECIIKVEESTDQAKEVDPPLSASSSIIIPWNVSSAIPSPAPSDSLDLANLDSDIAIASSADISLKRPREEDTEESSRVSAVSCRDIHVKRRRISGTASVEGICV